MRNVGNSIQEIRHLEGSVSRAFGLPNVTVVEVSYLHEEHVHVEESLPCGLVQLLLGAHAQS